MVQAAKIIGTGLATTGLIGAGAGVGRGVQSLTFIRFFSTNLPLNSPCDKDKENLYGKIDSLHDDHTTNETEVEELVNELKKKYEGVRGKLTKYLDKRETKKDNYVAEVEQLRDEAEFEQSDIVQERALVLNMIKETTKQDILTLDSIQRRFCESSDREEPPLNAIPELKEKLKEQHTKTKQLISEFNGVKQNSEDVKTTDFYSWEPFDDF